MKIIKFKVILLFLVIIIASFSIASSKIDYNAPVPLGINIDLIEGLSEEERAAAIEAYYSNQPSIQSIYENFVMSIDEEKYFAGAYWDGTSFLLDENGEYLLEENGRPMRNHDRDLYILVTSLKIVPKELLNHPKIFFREVKYSHAQLEKFMQILWEHFSDNLSSSGIDVEENKIHIYFTSEFDESKLKDLLPEDTYYYEYGSISVEDL